MFLFFFLANSKNKACENDTSVVENKQLQAVLAQCSATIFQIFAKLGAFDNGDGLQRRKWFPAF